MLLTMIDTSLNQVDARIFWYNRVAESAPAALMRQALAMAEYATNEEQRMKNYG